MRFVLPILLIAVAVTLFFTYLDPTYARVSELRSEQATYDDALDRSKELIAVRDRLLDTYNNFSRDDLRRLERLLPDHVDSVRLIIDIDSIAAQYGLRVQDVSVSTVSDGGNPQPIGVVNLGFSVEASYEALKQFLMDLEDSLRILDVTSITFTANDTGFTRYSISVRTYWLK